MPVYAFACPCGSRLERFVSQMSPPSPPLCPTCDTRMSRRFSFSFRRSMPEHFNSSIGSYISNERDFKDGLKAQSEAATLRTGIEHNFVPADISEPAAYGVTDEGLDSTYRAHHGEPGWEKDLL